MAFIEKLKSLVTVNKRAFTAILVGSIMGILIGSVLLVITYVVLGSVFTVASSAMVVNSTMNASLYGNMTVITQALTIVGISLIVAGVAGIIYILLGVAGFAGGRGQ